MTTTYNTYDLGQTITFSAEFYNSSSALADPTKVIFKWKTPAGAIYSGVYPDDATITRVAAGRYYIQLDLPTASASANGAWRYAWYGTSALKAAYEGQFRARDSVFD